MKKISCMLLSLFFVFSLVLSACTKESNSATPENTPQQTSKASAGETGAEEQATPDENSEYAAKYPGGIDFDALKDKELDLEVLMIPNYLTDPLWDFFFKNFQEDHPKWKIKNALNPQAGQLIQSRILAGDPPAFYSGIGENRVSKKLVDQGVIAPIDDLLASKAYDSDMTVSDMMMDKFENQYVIDGKHYAFQYRYSTNGVLYNVKMFEEHGWEVPETWGEFEALMEKIKQTTKIVPLMFSGVISQYPADMFVAPNLAYFGGGQEYLDRMARFEEGAFKNEPMRKSLERFVSLIKNGYSPKSVLGLDHTQSQMEFLQGRAAMLLCGSWFEGEMQDSIPAGFEYKMFPLPVRTDKSESLYLSVIPNGFVLDQSDQLLAAKEFLRYFFSNEFMVKYVEEFGEPMITNTEALKQVDYSKISVGAQSFPEQMAREDVKTFNFAVPTADGDVFYGSPIYNILHKGLQGLIAGNITIDKLMDDMEAAAVTERQKK